MCDFSDLNKSLNHFINGLNFAIKLIKSEKFNPKNQIESVSEYRSEHRIKGQWFDFLNDLDCLDRSGILLDRGFSEGK